MSNQPQAGKKILFVVLGVFLSLFLALFLINQVKAVPSTPGSGSGIIKYNPAFPNSVSFSTSTVMIGTSTLDTTLLPNPPTSPSTNPKLFVNGQFVVNSIVANDIIANSINGGNFTGKIDAKNVLPGVFNQPDSGIYVFPGYLGIATTTQVGLPQALSVYGGGYFRDKISIGTANDVGSALLAENIESNSDAITGRNSSDIGESGGVGVRGIGSNNGGMGVIAETLDSVNGYDFVGFGPRSYFAGNVGIGTGNPASKLGISGNVTIGLSSGFSDPSSPRAAPAGGLIVEGSVGIGTYTPSYSLHVAGNSMVTGSSSVAGTAFLNGDVNLGNAGSFTGDKINFVGGVASNINFYNAGPGAGITYDINGAVGGVGANGGGIIIKGGTSDGGASPLNSNGGDVSFLGGRGGESNSSSLGGNVNITGGSSNGTGGGAIIFNTYAPGVFASPTERMRISRTGNITTGAGTVGIGTTAQVSKLGVAGNVSIGSTYAASDAPSNGLLVEGNVNIGDTAAIAKLQVTSAGSSAIRLKKTAGVAGSVDLFVAIGGTGDGNAICRTVVPANSICLGYWTSGGATTACTGVSITGGRALCADFGD